MNLWYLYFLLPVILFPLAATINVANGRKIGSQKASMYRQLTLTIIWSPVIFLLIEKWELIQKHFWLLLLCGLLWAIYLSASFYAMNLTSVWISRSFVTVSRTLSAFIIWYTLFSESIGWYDFFGIWVIFLGFALFYKVFEQNFSVSDLIWITISLIWWVIFSPNTLVFKTFAIDFPGIEAAYLLESSSVLFLIAWQLIRHKWSLRKSFSIDQKNLSLLFLTAPLILIASYGLAKSVHIIPFYIFNTLFVLSLVISIILSWIFLWEKFTLRQASALWTMILWCAIVVVL